MSTQLRVYRTYRWVTAVSMSEMRIGGRNAMYLKSFDELQYRNYAGVWTPIPVVSESAPEHPHDVEDRKHQVEVSGAIEKLLDDFFQSQKGDTDALPQRTCGE